mmetsp:Transcript_49020/g.88625  ORF Transcript_49020/g.88625 Transcript_49020/m.88625 type:complete len:213 (-) Transcript_49020:576-1214(-)
MTSPGRTWKNVARSASSTAAARASIVLPQPGGPNSSSPFRPPRTPLKSEGSARAGQMTASRSAILASSRPMTSSKPTFLPIFSTSTRVRSNSALILERSSSSLASWPSLLAFLSASLTLSIVSSPRAPIPVFARSWRSSNSTRARKFRSSSSCACRFTSCWSVGGMVLVPLIIPLRVAAALRLAGVTTAGILFHSLEICGRACESDIRAFPL